MKLCLILGDQLNKNISSLKEFDKNDDLILMCEVNQETQYVKHHKKKIAFIFSAMRHFAQDLIADGFNVSYIKLNDKKNTGSLEREIERAIKKHNPDKVAITEPSEYRVLNNIKSTSFDVPVEILDDDRFLCTHKQFSTWADGRKQLRMEYFYREMRKQYNILMDTDKPVGGKWNYDSENRKPPKQALKIPQTYQSQPDKITQEVIALVDKNFQDHFGDLYPFHFAVTREQALEALDQFIKERLINFGDYQDIMIEGQAWIYHSHLSFYINCGLLLPLECVKAAEQAYRNNKAPLNAVEGFIRQIIGWREYVRGIYWLKMPAYESENFLNAKRKLPALYWGKDTHMNCLKQCVSETKENAYAHHIQRLMVLGNFALLAGIEPDEVNEWYMIVYADAYQWVELPNVTGMILFADGGLLGSKPYAASGAYINKMSDYCKNCHYKVSKKNGEDACPFNYLYWDFLMRNQDKLKDNHRLAMIYKTLNKMSDEKIQAIKEDSHRFFASLDNHEKV
jgi:deoxyribodipyrimidine photolyase-related protein